MSYFVKHSGKGSKRGKQVALPITIISLLLPIVSRARFLFFYLGVRLNSFALRGADFRTMISWPEVLSGIYIGYIVAGLFAATSVRKKQGGRSSSFSVVALSSSNIQVWLIRAPRQEPALSARLKRPRRGCEKKISRGIASKVAKLWQVVALPASIFEEQIARRSAMVPGLHPAGLEPETYPMIRSQTLCPIELRVFWPT